MRVPVYMNPNVKWRDAGVNGGDGKLRIGGSDGDAATGGGGCDFAEGQESKAV